MTFAFLSTKMRFDNLTEDYNFVKKTISSNLHKIRKDICLFFQFNCKLLEISERKTEFSHDFILFSFCCFVKNFSDSVNSV